MTIEQKLEAVCSRYYLRGVQNNPWNPQKGDYYTTCRNDRELYFICDVDDDHIYTVYCDRECEPSKWKKEEFLLNFGLNRVHVPMYILNPMG